MIFKILILTLMFFAHEDSCQADSTAAWDQQRPSEPAIPAHLQPTVWKPGFICKPNKYIYGGKISGGVELHDTTFEPYCHDGNDKEFTEDTNRICSRFVVGFKTEWIPSVGLSYIHFQCENEEWVKVWDSRAECLKDSLVQRPFRCNASEAVCGFQQGETLLENLKLTCCGLTKKIIDTIRPIPTVFNGKPFDVIGPVNPNNSANFKPQEPQFCVDFAYGLDIIKASAASYELPTHAFNLKCGEKQELSKKDCPWFMNGIQVEIIRNIIHKVWIHCYDNQERLVYQDFLMERNSSKAVSKTFYCPDGKAVCGYIMDEDFLSNFKLACCELKIDNLLHRPTTSKPIIRYEQLYYNRYQVGLLNLRKDTKFKVKDFNEKTNPIILQILNSIEVELVAQNFNATLMRMPDFTVQNKSKDGIFDNQTENTFQLTVRYENYKFNLDLLKFVQRSCSAVEEESEKGNILDCSCTFKQQSYTKRACKYRWRIHAIATEKELYQRTHMDKNRLRILNRKNMAQVSLGLVQRPITLRHASLNTYLYWTRIDETKGYIETIEDYLCPYRLGSIKSFDYTSRLDERLLHFDTNSTNIYLYFQLVAKCDDDQFIIYYDKYQDIKFSDGTKWDDLNFMCEIPLQEGVLHHRVKYYCNRIKDAADLDFSPPPPTAATTAKPTRGSTLPTTEMPVTLVTRPTKTPKLNEVAETIFVLDGCKNGSDQYFNDAKIFIQNFVANCPRTTVAIIEYSTMPSLVGISASLSLKQKLIKINGIKRSDNSERKTDLALIEALDIFDYYNLTKRATLVSILFAAPSKKNLINTMSVATRMTVKGIKVLNVYIKPPPPPKEDDDDSEEVIPPEIIPMIQSSQKEYYEFEDSKYLLGNMSRITCLMCLSKKPKLTGERVIFLLDVTKSDYEGFDNDFENTKQVMVEFIESSCPANEFRVITFSKTAQEVPLNIPPPGKPKSPPVFNAKIILDIQISNETKRHGIEAFRFVEIDYNLVIAKLAPLKPTTIVYVAFGKTRKLGEIKGVLSRLNSAISGLLPFMISAYPKLPIPTFQTRTLIIGKHNAEGDAKEIGKVELDRAELESPFVVEKALEKIDCQFCRRPWHQDFELFGTAV